MMSNITTTSSKSLDDNDKPNNNKTKLITKLAENITRKQKHYENLSTKKVPFKGTKVNNIIGNETINDNNQKSYSGEEYMTANKLKRKTALSSSLISVTDSVNQEKRTCIEGVQLNCRGKLRLQENLDTNDKMESVTSHKEISSSSAPQPLQSLQLSQPPPLLSSSMSSSSLVPKCTTKVTAMSCTNGVKMQLPPPRLKRQLQENIVTIQRLSALAEQLRLEVNELKVNLTNERSAVRVLRAQNESETRKWKTEVKKLQSTIESLKKGNISIVRKLENVEAEIINPINATSLVNMEIQRLTNEINSLKEANKVYEDKKLVNSDADKRKAADIRELKDSYEKQLSQIQKSAKNEITRLLEEIKSKERIIGQLKKDLKLLQNSYKISTHNDLKKSSSIISRNATTINHLTNKQQSQLQQLQQQQQQQQQQQHERMTCTAMTMIMPNLMSNQNKNGMKKMKSTTAVVAQNNHIKLTEQKNHVTKEKIISTTEDQNQRNQVQQLNEISKLTNIELINNTKNLTKSQNVSNDYHKASQIPAKELTLNSIQQHLKALEIPDDNENHVPQENYENLLRTTTTTGGTTITTITTKINDGQHNNRVSFVGQMNAAATIITSEHEDEDKQLTEELEQHLFHGKQHQQHQQQQQQQQQQQKQHQHQIQEQQKLQKQQNTDNNINQINTKEEGLNNCQQQSQRNGEHQNHEQEQEQEQNQHHNSDSDSALSSAPPSISPQPSTNGVESTDIWQTIRSYTQDVEKLQKEIQRLEEQNASLRAELQMAKEQIIDYDKSSMENCSAFNSAQLFERIKCLEKREHQLQDEYNDLREQNELLEFRILELEESHDKNNNSHSNSNSNLVSKALWSCTSRDPNSDTADPFKVLFDCNSTTHTNYNHNNNHNNNNNNNNNNSLNGTKSLMARINNNMDENITCDISNEELFLHLNALLEKPTLALREKQCLQNIVVLLQRLIGWSLSFNTIIPNNDGNNSLDMVRAGNSDSNFGSAANICMPSTKLYTPNSARIVATVSPYNSNPIHQHNNPLSNNKSQISVTQITNSTESPRKVQQQYHQIWQNSLSESGVFVEADFLSDASEQNVWTQTDFEDSFSPIHSVKRTQVHSSPIFNKPSNHTHSNSFDLDQKRLDYYKDRLDLLERKISVYESSGDLQTKRLADRLQREIQLEQEVKELRDRVNILVNENASLEEEKCEFEEAENDTRLRLQRLEVELEILSQRNIELEVSREALSAKYKDCHSDCLNLRDDLATSETLIRHLEEDKQKAKENFDFLHSLLPLFLISAYNYYCSSKYNTFRSPITLNICNKMGNVPSNMDERDQNCNENEYEKCVDYQMETHQLKEEIKCLRYKFKELNARYCAAMESADSHWADLEREYKEREDQFRAKEFCLKQKIQKLQNCLCDDTRAANEKICQLEESEESLKTCLIRVTKELRDLQDDHNNLIAEFKRTREESEHLKKEQTPLTEALEQEKKQNKTLNDELNFARKLQQEMENQYKAELDATRAQMYEVKKDFLHIEVTNGELKEEVECLEQQLETLQSQAKENEDKIRCLTDEVRTKDELCQKLEKRLQRSEGTSLADELGDSPTKRLRRDDVKDLKTATRGLVRALRIVKESEPNASAEVRKILDVAEEVSLLARSLLEENDVQDDDQVTINTNPNDLNEPNEQNEPTEQNEQNEQTEHKEQNEEPEKNEQDEVPEQIVENVVVEGEVAERGVEENVEREEGGEQPLDEVSSFNAFVGMALMPEFKLDEDIWPSYSQEMKRKVICEVPSELRKLSTSPSTSKPQTAFKSTTSIVRKKRGRRCMKSRMTRGRFDFMNARLRRIVSCIQAQQSTIMYHDVSELDSCQSELLERLSTHSSFHSVQEELIEISNRIDVSTETEIKQSTVDIGTEALVSKVDSCIQVIDEVEVEKQLNLIPAHICCFLNILKASTSNADVPYAYNLFNVRLIKFWESDNDFRQGLEILSAFSAFKSDDVIPISLQNYEDFVNAMSSLQLLRELFKPTKIPMLCQIEEQLNESLMTFHNRKMESEFYCTVYYPVKRPDPTINIVEFPKA